MGHMDFRRDSIIMATAPRPQRDLRVTLLTVFAIAAALYWALQRTSVAPFPHTADDFVGGLAIGTGIGALVGWLGARR